MNQVDLQNEAGYPVDEPLLERAANIVLQAHQRTDNHALSIVITDDNAVAALNNTYRGVQTPTDVLSFPAEPIPGEIAGDEMYLGDLVIAFPYTQAQTEREGHGLDETLALLVIHGTLHLLGYDHDTPENRAVMWDAQDQALRAMQISTDIVPALETSVHE